MKRVRCQSCGYLYASETRERFLGEETLTHDWTRPHWETTVTLLELPFRNIEALRESGLDLHCHRYGTFEREREEVPKQEASAAQIADLATKLRECPFFFKHEPGYGPQQHLQLREKMEEQQSARRWAAIQTLIGAAVVLLALVVEKLL